MEKVLIYKGRDGWSRPVYRDENGRIWVDTDPRSDHEPQLCTITDAGEPCDLMRTDIRVTFISCRDVWY